MRILSFFGSRFRVFSFRIYIFEKCFIRKREYLFLKVFFLFEVLGYNLLSGIYSWLVGSLFIMCIFSEF